MQALTVPNQAVCCGRTAARPGWCQEQARKAPRAMVGLFLALVGTGWRKLKLRRQIHASGFRWPSPHSSESRLTHKEQDADKAFILARILESEPGMCSDRALLRMGSMPGERRTGMISTLREFFVLHAGLCGESKWRLCGKGWRRGWRLREE